MTTTVDIFAFGRRPTYFRVVNVRTYVDVAVRTHTRPKIRSAHDMLTNCWYCMDSKTLCQHSSCTMIAKSRFLARHYHRFFTPSCFSGATSLRSLTTTSSASSEDLVRVSDGTENKNVAILSLNRPPVNSLSMEMCQSISKAIKDCEDMSHVQGIVLASSNPKILSAGLDLKELHNPDPERLPKFWDSFQQLFIDLYSTRLATVAAIEGHAPAAGCMLAICCDYRVMTDQKGRIGLNETLLGIAAPPWLGQAMVNTIGMRNAELSLGLGLLYSPQEALDIGLVDKVVPADAVMPNALDEAAKWAKIPAQARVASKLLTRQEYIDGLEATRAKDNDDFCAFIRNEQVQNDLGKYLEGLKKKK